MLVVLRKPSLSRSKAAIVASCQTNRMRTSLRRALMVLTKEELVALLAMVSHALISVRADDGVDLETLAIKLQWLVDNYEICDP
jgi:hypothetical protein